MKVFFFFQGNKVIQTIFTDIRRNEYEEIFPNEQRDYTYINLTTNCAFD